MTKTLAPSRVLGLVCLLVAAGCDAGHPYNTLDKTRLLAVRADLPEIAAGETATLDALVYSPDDVEITYAWSWCPWTMGSNFGFECILTQEDLDEIGLPLPALDLGADALASFPYPGPPELVQGLCESFLDGLPPASRKNFPDCTERMPITIALNVSDGQSEIVAVKEIDLVIDPEIAPNRNPTLVALEADAAGAAFEMVDGSSLESETAYDLRVAIDDASIQIYPDADMKGEPMDRSELLLFTWFFTAGDVEAGRTGTVNFGDGLNKALKNTWTTPRKAQNADFTVVLRDDRGGVDWISRNVDIVGGGR